MWGQMKLISILSVPLGQAGNGDTIIVKDGVYVEDIKVSRSVVLMSENLHGAVIGT